MYKRNGGFCDKLKVCTFEQSLVIDRKFLLLKSATTLIRAVMSNTHSKIRTVKEKIKLIKEANHLNNS
jgi:hypothetical protein